MADLRSHIPAERNLTVREALREALRKGPVGAKELSAEVGIPEKDVSLHLQHVERSAKKGAEKFILIPARCLGCGFTFSQRTRLSTPARCPSCASERIDPPQFELQAKG
jgi:transcriptional regulator